MSGEQRAASAPTSFVAGRDSRWQYADQTIQAIEDWNCSTGRGCVHGAAQGSAEHEEFGPGGTCGLLAAVFCSGEPIEQMTDDGITVTCHDYVQRPDPSIPAGQLPLLDDQGEQL